MLRLQAISGKIQASISDNKKVRLLYVFLELSPSEVVKLNYRLTLSKIQIKICILKLKLKSLN